MTQPGDSSNTDWWRLGAVGLAAVLLSLIGFGVASRYQPTGDPSPPVAADGSTTSAVIANTTTTAPTTTTPADRTTTTAVTAEPAVLTLDHDVLDFGEEGESIDLEIRHSQGGAANWSLSSESPGLSFDPAEGTIADGEVATATVFLDRSQIAEGEFETSLTLEWQDGEATAGVMAILEDNPIIHSPQASPSTVQVASGSGCSPTRTTVSARVRDTSELEQVIARWSPDGSTTRETTMGPVGDDFFEGVIGPYEAVGSDTVRVVAFDVRGNAGGATISVAVVACG